MYFKLLCNFCPKYFRFQKICSEIWSKIYIGPHVKYQLFLSEFNETWIFSTDFEKYKNIKFHENLSNRSRVVAMRIDGGIDRRTDMTQLTVAFRNTAKASKKDAARKPDSGVQLDSPVLLPIFFHLQYKNKMLKFQIGSNLGLSNSDTLLTDVVRA